MSTDTQITGYKHFSPVTGKKEPCVGPDRCTVNGDDSMPLPTYAMIDRQPHYINPDGTVNDKPATKNEMNAHAEATFASHNPLGGIKKAQAEVADDDSTNEYLEDLFASDNIRDVLKAIRDPEFKGEMRSEALLSPDKIIFSAALESLLRDPDADDTDLDLAAHRIIKEKWEGRRDIARHPNTTSKILGDILYSLRNAYSYTKIHDAVATNPNLKGAELDMALNDHIPALRYNALKSPNLTDEQYVDYIRKIGTRDGKFFATEDAKAATEHPKFKNFDKMNLPDIHTSVLTIALKDELPSISQEDVDNAIERLRSF